MRLFWLSTLLLIGIAIVGCSDGKLNLLLVLWVDSDQEPLEVLEPEPSSSSIPGISSITPSSSSEPQLSSSSGEPASSSSEEPPLSSSSRGERPERSSGSKTNKDGEIFDDYPTLELDQPGVFQAERGKVTRYWDACKPSCTRTEHNMVNGAFSAPNGMAKQCDRNGNEMPLYFRMSPVEPTWAEFIAVPNACVPEEVAQWTSSPEYAEWRAANPGSPSGAQSLAHICPDQMPYAVNDTLAYAFVANSSGNCGKCFQLQFDGDFNYAAPRATHKALKGKTLIVMVNNFGVGALAFDLMIPGGGLGDYDALTGQLGISEEILGNRTGGLLWDCTFIDFGGMPERRTLEEHQECLREKCNRAFKNHPVHLKGCLWHADWLMAADNPEAIAKEVPCPKFLLDRYRSSYGLPRRPADLNPGVGCNIGGAVQCQP